MLLWSQVELKIPINFNMNNFTVKMKEMFCLQSYFYLISVQLVQQNTSLHLYYLVNHFIIIHDFITTHVLLSPFLFIMF